MDKFIDVFLKPGPNGGVEVKTTGYAGEACKAATKALEKRLGNVEADVPTEEALLQPEKQTEFS